MFVKRPLHDFVEDGTLILHYASGMLDRNLSQNQHIERKHSLQSFRRLHYVLQRSWDAGVTVLFT